MQPLSPPPSLAVTAGQAFTDRAQEAMEPTKKTTRTWNRSLSTAVSGNKLLPNNPLSALEIVTYFPNHTRWPDILFRLLRAGWTYKDIARAQLHARGELNSTELKRRDAALRQQALVATRAKFGPHDGSKSRDGPRMGKHRFDHSLNPIRAKHFTRKNGYIQGVLEHYDVSDAKPLPSEKMSTELVTLQQLANGVINHPEGGQSGLLTKCVRFAEECGWKGVDVGGPRDLHVGDIGSLANMMAFEVPVLARTDVWDQQGLEVARGFAVDDGEDAEDGEIGAVGSGNQEGGP